MVYAFARMTDGLIDEPLGVFGDGRSVEDGGASVVVAAMSYLRVDDASREAAGVIDSEYMIYFHSFFAANIYC